MDYKAISLNFLGKKDAEIIMKEFPGLDFQCYDQKNQPDDKTIGEADIICGYMGPELVRKAAKAKWLFAYQAGIDRVVEAVREKGDDLLFTNGSGLYGEQISEHLLALLLGLNRQINISVNNMSRTADKWGGHPFRCRDVAHATIGVVGLGDIGDRFAKTVHAMGARVLAYKRRPSDKAAYIEKLYLDGELEKMLPQCDVIAICLPGTEKTKNLFDEAMLSHMKEGSLLLNIGRGSIVNGKALTKALESGHLGGAGLDVTDPEPLGDDSPLWDRDNVIITPHMAGVSDYMPNRVRELFIKGMKAFLAGERLPNQVDLDEGY